MNPLTTWAPLVVIFGITAVKELVDDLGRGREDREANARQYNVVRGGVVQPVSDGEALGGVVAGQHSNPGGMRRLRPRRS